MIQAGVASEEDVKDAVDEGHRTGERFGEVLIRKGLATDELIGKMLAVQWQLPYAEARELEVDEVAAGRLPADRARYLGAKPIRYDEETIVLAVAEPSLEMFDRLAQELGQVSFVVVSRSTMEWLLSDEPLPDEEFAAKNGDHAGQNGVAPEVADQRVESQNGSGRPADPAEADEPAEAAEPAGAAEPTDAAEPADAAEPTEAAEPTDIAEPVIPVSDASTEAALAAIDKVFEKYEKLGGLLQHALPLVRQQLAEQQAAFAALEEARRRDSQRIRSLESELSRQGDRFEVIRAQATALAATFDAEVSN